MRQNEKSLVGIINTNIELIEALRYAIEQAGFATVTTTVYELKKGKTTLATVFGGKIPEVIVYDVALPYDDNWKFLQKVRNSADIGNARILITTTNKRALDDLIGHASHAFEITGVIGKPFDLDDLLQAVTFAAKEVRKERMLLKKNNNNNVS